MANQLSFLHWMHEWVCTVLYGKFVSDGDKTEIMWTQLGIQFKVISTFAHRSTTYEYVVFAVLTVELFVSLEQHQ